MKKILIPLVLLCLLLVGLAACGNPPATVEGLAYESLGNGTCKLVSPGGSGVYTLTVPDRSPEGERVVAIGEGAFRNAERLTQLVLPEGLEAIEKEAFAGCENLVTVTFPSTLKRVEDGAFRGCGNLFSIRLPKSIEKVGEGVFAYCAGLNTLAVEDGGAYFESVANCLIRKADKTVVAGTGRAVILGDVERIGKDAFRGMPLSESFTVPVGVTSIGDGAFFGASTLKKLFLPGTLTELGEGALGDNAALVSLQVAASNVTYRSEGNAILTLDGKTLLFGCNATVIPEGVEKIGAGAFRSMKRLASVTLPASVREIGADAFRDCVFLAEFRVDRTEEGFAAVTKGEGWNAGCSFTVSFVEAPIEN